MVATLDGEQVTSWSMTDDAWAQLRASYRTRELRMTCGGPGIPKTSTRGLRFFAHYPKQDCGLHLTGPETAEHQLAKTTLADAARAAGWDAQVEAVGPSREWIADVLITRGDERVALEVQWSPQKLEDFEARTARYHASGVKCVWFTGPANHKHSLPGGYQLDGNAEDGLTITVPSTLGTHGRRVPSLREGAENLFSGAFRSTAQVKVKVLRIDHMPFRCWSCQGWSSRWFIGAARGTSRCGKEVRLNLERTGHGEMPIASGELVPAAGYDGETAYGPEWGTFAQARPEEHAQKAVFAHLARHRMSPPCSYARRTSKQVPSGYIAAVCPRCGSMQGDAYFDPRFPRFQQVGVPFASQVTVPARHWCTDVGDGRCEDVPGDATSFPMAHQTVSVVRV